MFDYPMKVSQLSQNILPALLRLHRPVVNAERAERVPTLQHSRHIDVVEKWLVPAAQPGKGLHQMKKPAPLLRPPAFIVRFSYVIIEEEVLDDGVDVEVGKNAFFLLGFSWHLLPIRAS